MPYAPPSTSAALIGAFLSPSVDWSQVAAAKDRTLQLQQYATAQAEQSALESQQAAAQIAQFQASLKSLPYEAPDQRRIQAFLTKQEKQLSQRIATEYQGKVGDFWKTEGSDHLQHMLGELQQSEAFINAEHNKEQLQYIKSAVRKNENLVGEVVNRNGKTEYVPFTDKLNDYYAGRTPRIEFKGSYKADDDSVIKHFEGQYAPNADPWTETPVSEDHKQAYLAATNRPEVAVDKYYQQYQNRPIFWKRDNLVDKKHFEMEVGRYGMAQASDARDRSLFGLRKQGLQLTNELKAQKLAGEKAEGGGNGFWGYAVNNAVDAGSYHFDPKDGNKILPHSGYDLNRFSSPKTGKAQLFAIPFYGTHTANILAQKVGLGAYDKKTGQYANSDHIKEGFVEKNGFHALNLANSRFKVTALDPKIFFNQRDADTHTRGGAMGFTRVQVQFDSDRDAHESGLFNINGFDSVTKAGTGVYNSDTRKAWLTIPIGAPERDRMLMDALQRDVHPPKGAMGSTINTGIGLGDDEE